MVRFICFVIIFLAINAISSQLLAAQRFAMEIDSDNNISVYLINNPQISCSLSPLLNNNVQYILLCNHIFPCKSSRGRGVMKNVSWVEKIIAIYESGHVSCAQLPRHNQNYDADTLSNIINNPYINYGTINSLQFYEQRGDMFTYNRPFQYYDEALFKKVRLFEGVQFFLHAFFVTTDSQNYPFSAVVYDGYAKKPDQDDPSLTTFHSIKSQEGRELIVFNDSHDKPLYRNDPLVPAIYRNEQNSMIATAPAASNHSTTTAAPPRPFLPTPTGQYNASSSSRTILPQMQTLYMNYSAQQSYLTQLLYNQNPQIGGGNYFCHPVSGGGFQPIQPTLLRPWFTQSPLPLPSMAPLITQPPPPPPPAALQSGSYPSVRFKPYGQRRLAGQDKDE